MKRPIKDTFQNFPNAEVEKAELDLVRRLYAKAQDELKTLKKEKDEHDKNIEKLLNNEINQQASNVASSSGATTGKYRSATNRCMSEIFKVVKEMRLRILVE